MIVIFDLGTLTSDERRAYRVFRKFLLRNGYSNIQESDYVKLIKNQAGVKNEFNILADNSPDTGSVIAIPMSLNDFKGIK